MKWFQVRKSPEGSPSAGSNVADSGFGTSNEQHSNNTLLLHQHHHNHPQQQQLQQQHHRMAEVRWDAWERLKPPEDELHLLLDAIHRKAGRLRRDLDARVSLTLSMRPRGKKKVPFRAREKNVGGVGNLFKVTSLASKRVTDECG